MKKPRVSVVVPVYNEESYIEDCLKALFDQEEPVEQVIVVDNNSTDATLKIVKQFKHAILLRQKKQGQLYARATGFDYASSKLIATVDADTIVSKDWSKAVVNHYLKTGSEAFSGTVSVYEGAIRHRKSVERFGNFYLFKLSKWISGQTPLFGSNMVVSKSVWELIKDELSQRNDLLEDFEIGLLANQHGYKTSLMEDKKAGISIRSIELSSGEVYRRGLGWPKTYWKFKKVTAVIAFIIMHAIFIHGLAYRLVVRRGFTPRGPYSGW